MDITDPLSLTEDAVAAFTKDGNDRRDFSQWMLYNNNLRQQLIGANPKLNTPTVSQAADAVATAAQKAKDEAAAAAAKPAANPAPKTPVASAAPVAPKTNTN